MKILFIAKASKKEGLGHLIRSSTLADYIKTLQPETQIDFILLTDLDLDNLLFEKKYNTQILAQDTDIPMSKHYDIVIFDMLSMEIEKFKNIARKASRLVSISPIFDRMADCDMLISRTKYLSGELTSEITFNGGLQYSIIRQDCKPIDTHIYQSNLESDPFHIALCMGGTDPENNTLKLLREIKDIENSAVFWVLLGESYHHRYNDLIDTIKADKKHEIILAKANKSMWRILQNTSLAILTGGLTSYEAAYAGLPAINYFDDKKRSFLVKELEEKSLCFPTCYSHSEIVESIEKILSNKSTAKKIHDNCRGYLKPIRF